MTAAELDIIIGADVSSAVNGLKQVNTQLAKTEQAAVKTTQKSGKGFTELSRVVQDLPFGFTAISNNLTQLIPGVGALGLAFSAVVSAITFAQVGFSAWTGKTKAAKEATDEFAKSLKSAESGALATGVRLQSFVDIARDNTKSLKERNYALGEANKLMGEHGEKLTLVNINTAAATEEVNKYTQALIAQAVANKYSDKAADLIIKQKDALKAVGPALDNYNQLAKEANDINKVTVSGGTGGVGGLGNVGAINKARGALNDLTDARKAYSEVTTELINIQNEANQSTETATRLFSELGTKTKDTTKAVKEFKMPAVKFDIKAGRVTPLQDHDFDTINKEIGDFLAKHPLKPIVTLQPTLTLGDQMKAEIDATFGLLQQQLVGGLIAVGESIGNALAGAKNPFAPILAFLSEGLKILGEAYIKIGVAGLAAKNALKLLFESPALTVAAGIALVALSQILKNKASNVKAFATGGVVTKPTLALIGEQGPERVVPLGYEGRASNMVEGNVVFHISGQELRGMLKRADSTAYNTF